MVLIYIYTEEHSYLRDASKIGKYWTISGQMQQKAVEGGIDI